VKFEQKEVSAITHTRTWQHKIFKLSLTSSVDCLSRISTAAFVRISAAGALALDATNLRVLPDETTSAMVGVAKGPVHTHK